MVEQHTPAPWKWSGGRLYKSWPKQFASTNVFVIHDDRWMPRPADARLIAAAPDLLEAAQTVLAGLHARIDAADPTVVPVFSGIVELSDAIAKATGA